MRRLHKRLQPRTYFEIGVRKGRSLTLSRVPSVGVDPFFEVTSEVYCDVQLVRTTSDEFFARTHPFAHFEHPVDLAYIDGMHLAEFALRDLINTERHCHPASVIVVDDILPRNVDEGSRGRVGSASRGGPWAGDVYKVVEVLQSLRPDLVVLQLDTVPTGTLVILLPDADDMVLSDAYDGLVPMLVVPDPQSVPGWVIDRSQSVDPTVLLTAPIFPAIRAARQRSPVQARTALREVYRRAGLASVGEAP